MTDKLTDDDICRLMGWKLEYTDVTLVSMHWKLPDKMYIKITPDFNDERNIFKWVVPWLNAQDINVIIETLYYGKSGGVVVILNSHSGAGETLSDALRAALAQMQQEGS